MEIFIDLSIKIIGRTRRPAQNFIFDKFRCYHGKMKRHSFAWLIVMIMLGCGGPKTRPAARPTTHENKESRSLPEYDPKPKVRDETQKATKERRGSWSLTSDKVNDVAEFVRENAEKYNLPEDLLFGIIWVESRFDERAVSPVGARGLMQLMPSTAKYLAECIQWEGRTNSFSPEFNIAAGSYYIARLIREFNGNEDLALAAYNAGPTKVRQWLTSDGLPDVSVEYASMVQTARTFFSNGQSIPKSNAPQSAAADARKPSTVYPSADKSVDVAPSTPVITDEELDRLGLTILIAGLNTDRFGLEREDSENPFN
jgi:hypothetical protein